LGRSVLEQFRRCRSLVGLDGLAHRMQWEFQNGSAVIADPWSSSVPWTVDSLARALDGGHAFVQQEKLRALQ